MLFLKLPIELLNKILLYLQCPIAKLIKNEIETYEIDHNWGYTKMYKYYYIKNIMTFYEYYFDKIFEPYDYESYTKTYKYITCPECRYNNVFVNNNTKKCITCNTVY